jgi:type VI protein secretion system component VasF
MQLIDNVESQVIAAVGVVSPRLAAHLTEVRSKRNEEVGASTIEIVMYSFAFAVIAAAVAYIIWQFAKEQATAIPKTQDPGLGK